MTTYRQAADAGFKTLMTLWDHGRVFDASNGGCFWMGGNTFHVAVEYLSLTNQKDTYNLAVDALDLFDRKVTDQDPLHWIKDDIWVDDYGWWGIALVRAYNAASVLGYDDAFKSKLRAYAEKCWIGLHNCWDQSRIPNSDPAVDISGGIWNCNHSSSYLAGRNCVTNEVYWLFSLYMKNAFGDKYLDPNTNSAYWFSQGLSQNVLLNSEGLVRERFKGTTDNPYNRDYAWLGDQGLFMYGCFYNKQPEAGNLNQELAVAMGERVKAVRTSKPLVLSEELFGDTDFQLDYSGGKGVFIRNLAIINDHHHHSVPGPGPYDEWISKNGAAVWNHQLDGGLFPYWWNAEKSEPSSWGYPVAVANTVLHASGQSALNACITWMGDETINVPLTAQATK